MLRSRSPRGPPLVPGAPCPAMRSLLPSSAPGGMRTVIGSSASLLRRVNMPPPAAEQVFDVERRAPSGGAAVAATVLAGPGFVLTHSLGVEPFPKGVFAELVVESALLRVAQNFVRAVDFFELRLRRLVARIFV